MSLESLFVTVYHCWPPSRNDDEFATCACHQGFDHLAGDLLGDLLDLKDLHCFLCISIVTKKLEQENWLTKNILQTAFDNNHIL